MHFNLFATSVLLSMASALDLEASSSALALLEAETEAEADASYAYQYHFSDGHKHTKYPRPDENCCFFYLKENFIQRYKKPLCWDPETGVPSKQTIYSKAIKGVDCGKNTFVDLSVYRKNTWGETLTEY